MKGDKGKNLTDVLEKTSGGDDSLGAREAEDVLAALNLSARSEVSKMYCVEKGAFVAPWRFREQIRGT